MEKSLIDPLLWNLWKLNRPFLKAFAEAVIGEGKPELKPDGEAIVSQLEKFLRSVPHPVFVQIMLATLILPISLPKSLPRSNFLQFVINVWASSKSHLARATFLAKSRQKRAEYVDELFKTMASQAAEQEDDLIKGTLLLSTVKSLLSGAYMELDSTWQALGYNPYPNRDFDPPSGPQIINPPRTNVSTLLHETAKTPAQVATKPADRRTYCIIGSGAGGAIAAYSIQELDPDARIIILEAGPLVTNEAFPIRAMDATARLFMNAGATLTADQKFTFRQGRCVGGSTTLNNAIAIKPIEEWWDNVLVKTWESVGASLDWPRLNRMYDEIVPVIKVHELEESVITTAAKTVKQGFERLTPPWIVKTVPANTIDCIGCGRCNYGCQYDSKRSMLNTTIPAVVERGGFLVPNAKVERIKFSGIGNSRRVRSVVVEIDGGRDVEIEADKFILAAGAYASSKLLSDSHFHGAMLGAETVGKRFTCNFGSPVIGRFATPQHAWAGQQIGYVIDLPEERMVIETAFGPPAVLGFLAPQWGNEFMKVVESFDNLAVTAPTVASLSYGEIKRNLLADGGHAIDFKMGDEDWRRLAKGMNLTARAMFEMGAEEIYTTRFDAKTLKRGEGIDDYFAGIGPADNFKVESAHPQGGNVIHDDARQGVVDAGLKVHGVDNLWICDASVMPASITLNLQFTIMALARYAAKGIVAA
jgi:choline dehydrogenase-like flavoprotein